MNLLASVTIRPTAVTSIRWVTCRQTKRVVDTWCDEGTVEGVWCGNHEGILHPRFDDPVELESGMLDSLYKVGTLSVPFQLLKFRAGPSLELYDNCIAE